MGSEVQALDERCLDPIHQPALVRDVHLHLRSDTRDNNPLIALAGPLEGLASAHCLLGAAERPLDMNPTSPLGVGGLRSFLFHLPFFPFGEGFTPPPTPSPGPWKEGIAGRRDVFLLFKNERFAWILCKIWQKATIKPQAFENLGHLGSSFEISAKICRASTRNARF